MIMPFSSSDIQTVSVLIITHNRKDDLRVCLDSVARQKFPFVETVVVDNNSTDGTASMIREDYPDVRYVQLEENIGIAARNVGAKEASGDLLLTLDDDSELPWARVIDRVVKRFDENPKLGAAGFRIIDEEGRERPWFRWPLKGSLREGYFSPTFRGCGAAIRPEIFERVGGFWDPYFMFLEEQDLALRIVMGGAEVRFFPNISIIHRNREARRADARYIYYMTRNTFWYIWRNFPFLAALWLTLRRFVELGTMAMRKGGIGLYLKGLWDVRTHLREVFETREPLTSETRDRLHVGPDLGDTSRV